MADNDLVSSNEPTRSLTKSNNASLRQAFTERVTLSEAIRLAGTLVGCYPYGDKPADSYLGAIAEILREYPRFIVLDIRKLARECKFLPTVADVVAWCERQRQMAAKPLVREDLEDAAYRGRKQDEALEGARKQRGNLDELKAKYGPNWGIKQMSKQDEIENDRKRKARALVTEEANQRAVAALDAKFNWDTATYGYTPALARVVLEHAGKRVSDDEFKQWLVRQAASRETP
jgi:hypothetical protein